MKIRLFSSGFVSNSSSTSYLVYIPKEFKLSEEELQAIFDTDASALDSYNEFDTFKEEFEQGLDKIKNGSFCQYGNYSLFRIFEELITEKNFEIGSFDTGSEQGEIQNISEESIKKIKALP